MSGVLQGTLLSPRLFTVYLHDIPDILQSRFLISAEDLKVWRGVNSTHDTAALQDDLNLLPRWAEFSALLINTAKSVALAIRHCHTSATYSLCGCSIPLAKAANDLGILVRSGLKSHDHTAKVMRRGLRMLRWLRRSLSSWAPEPAVQFISLLSDS